jgi:hypothetical protein
MNVLSGLEISETYPLTNFRRSTGSRGVTLANPGAQQGSDWGKRTLVICGPSSSTSFGLFDLEGSFSRTSGAISRSASIASFKTWKDAVSAARSDCLRRRKSARRTDASGSSFSAWPTATGIHAIRGNHDEPLEKYRARVRDYEEGRAKGKPGKSLGVAVRLWPTATVGDSRGSANCTANRTKTGHHSGTTLIDAIRIWPTPTSRDWKDIPGMSRARGDNPNGREDTLPRKVHALQQDLEEAQNWPTPRTPTGGSESAERKKELGRTRSGGGDLQSEVRNWPTPTVAEGGKISCSPNFGQQGLSNHPEIAGDLNREKQLKTRSGMAGPHAPQNLKPNGSRGGLLNATWVETVMGFPIAWTDCAPSETP